MGAQTALILVITGVLWFVFFLLTFRAPDAPKLPRLLLFQLLIATSAILAYLFLVKVYRWNPNPTRVSLARFLAKDKTIYLGDFVGGVYDLDYINRIDTDGSQEPQKEEWLVFYQYDVRQDQNSETYTGPFGAAIYDYTDCRPPTLLSYELVATNYDYLGQDQALVQTENIIAYADPLSAMQDRTEVIIVGLTRGAATDLNVFRKVGIELDCYEQQQWRAAHPGEAFPNPLHYHNIGSFRGNFLIRRIGDTITVIDRAPFERSQITIEKQYRPENGSYFQTGTQTLLPPVEFTLAFGTGLPDQVTQVYYPEKAVLAFYTQLGKDSKSLEAAKGYLSPGAQDTFDIRSDQFGLAMSRRDLARVLVWEIRYQPNPEEERLRQPRQVSLSVVGVDRDGNIDYGHPCQVTWEVIGLENPRAQPYGCEWRLNQYQTSCIGSD